MRPEILGPACVVAVRPTKDISTPPHTPQSSPVLAQRTKAHGLSGWSSFVSQPSNPSSVGPGEKGLAWLTLEECLPNVLVATKSLQTRVQDAMGLGLARGYALQKFQKFPARWERGRSLQNPRQACAGAGPAFPLAGPSALGELCVLFSSGSLGKTRGPFRERRKRKRA